MNFKLCIEFTKLIYTSGQLQIPQELLSTSNGSSDPNAFEMSSMMSATTSEMKDSIITLDYVSNINVLLIASSDGLENSPSLKYHNIRHFWLFTQIQQLAFRECINNADFERTTKMVFMCELSVNVNTQNNHYSVTNIIPSHDHASGNVCNSPKSR